MKFELGIIGAGNMAQAIIHGVLQAGLYQPQQVCAADPSDQRLELFRNTLKVQTNPDNAYVAANCKTLLLCVKPQQIADALQQIQPSLPAGILIISIAAGISTGFIEDFLAAGSSKKSTQRVRVVRCMPNTPMLVGTGMAALCSGYYATDDDLEHAAGIFRSAAKVMIVPESKMDAVTAISGSGPAYFFFLVEQMVKAGILMGLDREQARLLAGQTALGAAQMLLGSEQTVVELRRQVTSPKGTTHAAINYLEANNWPIITVEAVRAAAKRSRELACQMNNPTN